MAAKRPAAEAMLADEDGPPKRLHAGPLDLKKVDNNAWLVKVPAAVEAAWSKMEEGALVGQLNLYTNADGTKQKLEIRLNDHQPLGADELKIPINFTLEAPKQVNNLLLINHEPKSVPGGPHNHAVGAKISMSYNMQPKHDLRYRGFTQQRLLKNTITTNYTRPVEQGELRKANRLNTKAVAWESAFKQIKATKDTLNRPIEAQAGEPGKKERLTPDELQSVLFRLFSQRPRWNLKELHVETGQSDDFLRSVLVKVADRHTTKEYRNQWELKPEYKAHAASSGGAPADS